MDQNLKEAVFVITQAVITVGLIGATIYLWVAGKTVPEPLSAATLIVLGYYFKTLEVVTAAKLRSR